MKITLLGTYYAPYIGGVETHMATLARALQTHGVNVDVVCLAQPAQGFRPAPGEEIIRGVIVRRVRSRGYGESLRWPSKLFASNEMDVIHLHGFSRPLVKRTLLDRGSTPLVITPHGGLHAVSTDHSFTRRTMKHVFDARVGPRWLGSAARVVCVTETEANYLRSSQRVHPSRIVVLPYPVTDELRVPMPRQPRSGRLLVLARLSRRKRIGDLLAALKLNPDLPDCDIAGPDADDARNLRRVADTMPEGRVRFLGPIEGRCKLDLLRRAKALVICSSWEGQSIAALEAIGQDLPVIASAPGAEGLPSDAIWTFPFGRLDKLTECIRQLDDPRAIHEIRGRMELFRRHLLSPVAYADRLVSVYEEAVAQDGTSGDGRCSLDIESEPS